MGVGQDGKVGVYGGVTVDTSGIGMLVGSWNLVGMTAEYQLKKMQRLVDIWAYLV